jgi:hypothetical protein
VTIDALSFVALSCRFRISGEGLLCRLADGDFVLRGRGLRRSLLSLGRKRRGLRLIRYVGRLDRDDRCAHAFHLRLCSSANEQWTL